MAYDIIRKLHKEKDFRDSNTILLHRAIDNQIRNKVNEEKLSILLYNLICDALEIEDKKKYLSELKRLSGEKKDDEKIALIYGRGLFNMINGTQKIEDKMEYLSELKRLTGEKKDEKIALIYGMGLLNMIIFSQEIEEKEEYLSELKRLSEEKKDNSHSAFENIHKSHLYILYLMICISH